MTIDGIQYEMYTEHNLAQHFYKYKDKLTWIS